MGSLSLPFLSSSRAVIIMMDDGVCVYKASGSSSSLMGSVIWRASEFETRVAELIRQTGAGSVDILNDAVEQHYRKEKIVIPTAFDKANIIKRRLGVAFPNYPMRAAVELKESTALAKTQAQKGDERGNVYLFAAAPSTETFSRVVRAIAQTDCNIRGYGLLPMESTGLVTLLAKKLADRWGGASGATWSVLVGQHHGGGLRQIVVRGNELALTRVTPIEEPKTEGEGTWSESVARELQSTLSYLARFGYTPEDGLNVIVLGDTRYAESLEGMISVPCNFESLSPDDAGRLLGIRIAKGGGEHYADGLFASWVAKKASLALPLTSKEIADVAGPRRMASAIMLVLSIGFGGVLYQTSVEAQQFYRDTKNLEVARIRQADIERIYQEELKRKEAMGIDVNLIKGALDIDSRVTVRHIDILSVLKSVSQELKDLRMDEFEFKNDGDALWTPSSPDQQPPVRAASFKLSFSFAGNVNPKDGNKEMTDLADRLAKKLSPLGYSAKVSQPLQNLTYTGEVDKEVGLTANQRSLSDRYRAEILIQKVENVQSSGK